MKNKYLNRLIVCFAAVILLSSIGSLLLFTDETFSMGIIKNNLVGIIKIDSMDVHPPLYYIVLKLFLTVTTFWTKNLFVKIVFSRLLSFVFTIVTFIYLQKMLNIFMLKGKKNKVFNFSILIILTALPFKYVPIYNSMQIRMYALAAMFVTIQLYYMIKFDELDKKKYLILFIVFSIFSAYTHYISGLISGLLIVAYFIFCKKNKINYLLSGIILLVSYTPWIPVSLKQFGQITGKHWWMTTGFFMKNVILMIILMALFIYPLLNYINNVGKYNYQKTNIKVIISVMFMLVIVVVITSLLGSPMFQGKYMYPLLLIYVFLSIIMSMEDNFRYKLYTILIIAVIVLGGLNVLKMQVLQYNLSAPKIMNSLNKNKKKKLRIRVDNNAQSPEIQTKLAFYKYNEVYVINYRKYINHFKNSNININKNNYYLNKYVYFYDRSNNG